MSFFIIPTKWLQSRKFKNLTITQRVFLLWLLKLYNDNQTHSLPNELPYAFYVADDVVAATLNITPMTVKNARKALRKEHYIKAKQGGIYATKEGVKYKATVYYLDSYRDFLKELRNGEGGYITYPKYTFESLLRQNITSLKFFPSKAECITRVLEERLRS